MKMQINLCAMTVAAAVLGYSLILTNAGNAQGSAFAQGNSGNYELLTPQGTGPFPAVVVMHGCDGVNENTRRWAGRLVGWGYAALIVDSFRWRGLSNICGNAGALPASVRAHDATAAKNYLRSLPNIAKGRIGLIGFSHGAGAALAASTGCDPLLRRTKSGPNLSWTPSHLRRRRRGRRNRPNAAISFIAPWQIAEKWRHHGLRCSRPNSTIRPVCQPDRRKLMHVRRAGRRPTGQDRRHWRQQYQRQGR